MKAATEDELIQLLVDACYPCLFGVVLCCCQMSSPSK
jgi:hypothetical protein